MAYFSFRRSLAPLLATLLGTGLIAWQDSPEVHLGRGYDALKSDRYEEAVTEFREALRIDPALTARARFPLGVALFEMKRTSDARTEFETVRRELGSHPNVLYYLGRIDLMDQKFDEAIRSLTEAMAQPPYPDTAYHLGFAYLKKGDLAAAEKWFKVAAQATPADSSVPYQLAMVYRKSGREEEAKKAFTRSTELRRSSDEESQLRLDCKTKLEQGPREEAIGVCARLYDPDNAEKLTALGTIYGQHGDLEAALEPLRRAAELEPQSPQMQYNLAFTYFELNKLEEARAPVARALERWPDLFQLNSLYGAVLLKMGREREAWPVLLKAHQLNQQDAKTADLIFQTALNLARTSFGARQYSDAVGYLEEAAKLRPDDAELKSAIEQVRKQAAK